MQPPIKIILAILLLLCLFKMPYEFYELVRYLALVGFSALALLAKKEGKQTQVFVYIALAVLFQPLFKIGLGRTIWNIIDVGVAFGLLGSLIKK